MREKIIMRVPAWAGFGWLAVAALACAGPNAAAPDSPGGKPGAQDQASTPQPVLGFIGTYTKGDSKGIYAVRMNSATGALTLAGVAAELRNPSFLALSPDERFLYAVAEVENFHTVGPADPAQSGGVVAFRIDAAAGTLTEINRQFSRGANPCHLTVDRAGKNLLVANYSGGNVASLPIRADGGLEPATGFVQHAGSSVNPNRQKEPHAHSINLSPDNRFAFVADLGLDQILVYRFDANAGTLTPHDPPFARLDPGAGPRHFSFHPSGRFAYAINELTSTVTTFSYDGAAGALTAIDTVSTLPAGPVPGNSTAEIRVSADGRFVYGSNRGHDSIAAFQVNADSGRLTPASHTSTGGKTPRNFTLDPSGRFVVAANQNSHTLVSLRIDETTGALTPVGHQLAIPSPVCVRFLNPAAGPAR